jgi:DNA-binding XRE family transcriptional regulator
LTTIYNDTGLTQKELAQAIGLSRSRLADIVSS